jgi:hypothetical protein
MSTARALMFIMLFVGIGMTLVAVFTPGTQLFQSIVGGALIGGSLSVLLSSRG